MSSVKKAQEMTRILQWRAAHCTETQASTEMTKYFIVHLLLDVVAQERQCSQRVALKFYKNLLCYVALKPSVPIHKRVVKHMAAQFV